MKGLSFTARRRKKSRSARCSRNFLGANMSPDEIRHCDSVARRRFTYREDGKIDEWRSHADEALAGEPYADDCDGLASTAIDLCCRAGLPEADAYRLAVFASSDGSGHMVACATDDDGRMWIIGDTFRSAYRAEQIQHKSNIYRRLSESPWRGGFPWTLKSSAK